MNKYVNILVIINIFICMSALFQPINIQAKEDKNNVVYDVKDEITNHSFIMADVHFDGEYRVDAYLNGKQKIEGEDSPGKYKIILEKGDNEIKFIFTDGDGNSTEYVKKVYLDTAPPLLALTEDVNNLIISEDSVYISGYSEADAELTINGDRIDTDNGYFNRKIELDFGKNVIEIAAEDRAGNKTVYYGEVTYELGKSERWELYIICFVIVLLSIVYFIIFKNSTKKKKEENQY